LAFKTATHFTISPTDAILTLAHMCVSNATYSRESSPAVKIRGVFVRSKLTFSRVCELESDDERRSSPTIWHLKERKRHHSMRHIRQMQMSRAAINLASLDSMPYDTSLLSPSLVPPPSVVYEMCSARRTGCVEWRPRRRFWQPFWPRASPGGPPSDATTASAIGRKIGPRSPPRPSATSPIARTRSPTSKAVSDDKKNASNE